MASQPHAKLYGRLDLKRSSEKVVRLRISRGSTSEHTQRALSLISDAAQLISDMEERAKLYKRTATHCSLTQSKS